MILIHSSNDLLHSTNSHNPRSLYFPFFFFFLEFHYYYYHSIVYLWDIYTQLFSFWHFIPIQVSRQYYSYKNPWQDKFPHLLNYNIIPPHWTVWSPISRHRFFVSFTETYLMPSLLKRLILEFVWPNYLYPIIHGPILMLFFCFFFFSPNSDMHSAEPL